LSAANEAQLGKPFYQANYVNNLAY